MESLKVDVEEAEVGPEKQEAVMPVADLENAARHSSAADLVAIYRKGMPVAGERIELSDIIKEGEYKGKALEQAIAMLNQAQAEEQVMMQYLHPEITMKYQVTKVFYDEIKYTEKGKEVKTRDEAEAIFAKMKYPEGYFDTLYGEMEEHHFKNDIIFNLRDVFLVAKGAYEDTLAEVRSGSETAGEYSKTIFDRITKLSHLKFYIMEDAR